ncbi:MAG TPA: SDR family oxidoreductase [Verrucomicrobiae bacterium]|mgnify:CR=1 FL=1|nr:SDR family oxidoreductase [Verrucomicrobiae bacterium]
MNGEIEAPANPFGLTGQDHWVVGGAGYLGRAVVELLARMGARVLCVDLEDKARAFVEGAGLGARVTASRMDADDAAAVGGYIAAQIAERGIPHGLVMMNCSSTSKGLEELGAEDFDRVNHGNLTATFVFAREAAIAMRAAGRGSVVLFSSMYGSVSPDPSAYESPMNPNPIEYGVDKAGIQQMARYLAVHFGKDGVRCNSISPGPFPNPEVRRLHPEFVARLAKKVPLGRVGCSGEIAGAVAFLLSDAASYINGVNLPVDGGWTAW